MTRSTTSSAGRRALLSGSLETVAAELRRYEEVLGATGSWSGSDFPGWARVRCAISVAREEFAETISLFQGWPS